MVITTFIDLTRTTMVYRLAYMKKSGNRLSRCPDFVIHYRLLQRQQANAVTEQAAHPPRN
ncbi:hypothetical protein CFM96_23230 [Klebsiella michiganensis]|nr:hypothetical protein [Klebsiella michiganensis]